MATRHDGQLLSDVASDGTEAAFEELVQRHGSMVLNQYQSHVVEGRGTFMNILRWILVLPAAVFAHSAVQFIGGGAVGLLEPGVRDSSVTKWLYLVVYYVVSEMAFVVAGAKTAPRRQSATAVTLTILGIGLSLTKHVVGQQLAGNRVGTTNYVHAGLETTGLLAGAALILVSLRIRRLREYALET